MRKKKETKQWSMVSALEAIWKSVKEGSLNEELFDDIEEPAEYVKGKFGINPMQSVILALLADSVEPMSTRQIANALECSNITLMSRNEDFEDLCGRHMIRHACCHYRGEESDGFVIFKNCLDCIKADSGFVPEDMKKLSQWQFLSRVGNWLRDTERNTDNYYNMLNDIDYLVVQTQHLKLSRFLKENVEVGNLTSHEMVFFLIACCTQILRRQPYISACNYDDIMEASYACSEICEGLNIGDGNLSKLQLLENDCTDGVADRNDFRLTKEACTNLLSDYKVPYSGECRQHTEDLIQPADIVSKKLYFNQEEGRQIERLRDLLSPEKFCDVQKRLKESGLRSGFCVLMHGEPGSGKTESVYQLCKESGHPIYQVNISELKSKWVGDSERQVQSMFDRYNSLVKEAARQNEPVPVLFLNEADAIMGRRLKGESADSAVGKMENAIQNIILQGMEHIEGILVATTNLTDNLDSAMSRRWIFTIRYDKPSAEVKAKIFRSMIPELSAREAASLAKEFPDFCGGQCENVTRRLKVEHVLYNTPFSVDRVRQLCREEGIKKVEAHRSIGFH